MLSVRMSIIRICMYTYIHICTHEYYILCMHKEINKHMHICIYIYTPIHQYVHMFIYACMSYCFGQRLSLNIPGQSSPGFTLWARSKMAGFERLLHA